jgi:hypothetical protein
MQMEESKENHYLMINYARPKIVFHGAELSFDRDKYKGGKWTPYSYSGVGDGQKGEFFSALAKKNTKFDSPSGTKRGANSAAGTHNLIYLRLLGILVPDYAGAVEHPAAESGAATIIPNTFRLVNVVFLLQFFFGLGYSNLAIAQLL